MRQLTEIRYTNNTHLKNTELYISSINKTHHLPFAEEFTVSCWWGTAFFKRLAGRGCGAPDVLEDK